MDVYKLSLVKSFSGIINRYNKFQLSNHTSETIKSGNAIISRGLELLRLIKSHAVALETALRDCQDFMEDVTDDLSVVSKKEDFVYATVKGMLSYKGRDFVPKPTKPLPPKPLPKLPPKLPPTIKLPALPGSIPKPLTKRVLIPEIKYYLNMRCVSDLKSIQPMLAYYNNPNDRVNKPGLYCTLMPNVHVRVPFPDVIDSTKEYGRGHSIRCKYITSAVCDEQRTKMAHYHNRQVRTCNFAHTGEKLVKIGYPSRCAKPSFGNSQSLVTDRKLISLSDIKNILLYGLNDIMSSIVWLDCHRMTNIVMSDVERA